MNDDYKTFERRLIALADELFSLPDREQKEFLTSIVDPEMARRLTRMLDQNLEAEQAIPTGGGIEEISILDTPPEKIGPFETVRELGRGGMGVVYLAKRTSNEFEQTVAIKVLRQLRMTEAGRTNFRHEMNILSTLSHPKIAQIYDAGETDDGLIYFVMEYINGEPLGRYIENANPSLARRFEIFFMVCEAIGYAHSRLIVHQDLSPANILMTIDGHLKLIDFGIATNLGKEDQSSAPSPITEGFSAPENATTGFATTQADIYSLGRLLNYLVGNLHLPRASDFRAIISKATAANPTARYETVEALQSDVQAYLDRKAVSAVSGNHYYLARRFFRRHFIPITALVALLFGSLALAGIYRSLLIDAKRAEIVASQRFDDVRALGTFMVFDLYDSVDDIPGSIDAQKMLVEESISYLETLSETPDAPVSLIIEIADGYARLGNILGDPTDTNLGRIADASDLLARAAKLLETVPAQDRNANYQRTLARVHNAEAHHTGVMGLDFEQAIEIIQETKNSYSKLIDENNATPKDIIAFAGAYTFSGYMKFHLERFDAALVDLETAQAALNKIETNASHTLDVSASRARNTILTGEVLAWRAYESDGDYTTSLIKFDEGLRQLRDLEHKNGDSLKIRLNLISALHKHANTACYVEGQRLAGLESLKEADNHLALLKAMSPNDVLIDEHMQTTTSFKLSCYHQMGDLNKAITTGNAAVKEIESLIDVVGPQPNFVSFHGQILDVLAHVHNDAGDPDTACRTWKKSQALLQTDPAQICPFDE